MLPGRVVETGMPACNNIENHYIGWSLGNITILLFLQSFSLLRIGIIPQRLLTLVGLFFGFRKVTPSRHTLSVRVVGIVGRCAGAVVAIYWMVSRHLGFPFSHDGWWLRFDRKKRHHSYHRHSIVSWEDVGWSVVAVVVGKDSASFRRYCWTRIGRMKMTLILKKSPV